MTADEETRSDIVTLIEATYRALSTPGATFGELFDSPDIAVAGSGVGELFTGPEAAIALAANASSWGFDWNSETITVWRRGDVAWAQILGTIHVTRSDFDGIIPYRTTGVFGRENGRWRWLYWGGTEPQNPPRI